MDVRPAALVALVVAAAALAGCGGDDVKAPAPRAASKPVVKSNDYVASPTLMEGSSQRLFAIPRLGRFATRCTGPARAEISYRVARKTADQLVTLENRAVSSNRHLRPGQRTAFAVGRQIGARVEWQIALFSKGRIKVATASFAVAPLAGSHGCFVSGKAEVAERQR